LDERGESFIKNVTLGKNSDRAQNAIRLQGVLRPDAETEAVFTVMHHRQRNDGGSDYMPVSRATYNTLAGVNTGKFEIANNIEGYQNLDTDAQSLRLKKLASGVEYTVVAANRETKSNSLVDFNYTPTADVGLYASSSRDKITNQYLESRARFLPNNLNKLDFTIGVSYMKQSYDVHNIASRNSMFFTEYNGTGTFDLIKASGDNKSIFANASLPLNDSGMKLLGGLRQEWANRTGQNDPSFFSGSPLKASDVAKTSIASRQLTWKFGVSDLLENGADLYAHVASGWRPSAVNYYASNASAPRTVDKEKSITYEAGYRQATDSQYFAAAVFMTRVNDYQETKYGGTTGTAWLANVAKVEIPGFEIEGRQAVNKALTVFGGLGYTRARYDRYAEFRNLEGKALGNRPDWNLHVGGAYKVGPMTYTATVVGTSSFYSAYTESGETTKIDGHLIGNLRATYQVKNYSISAYVNNIADKEYFLNAGYYNYFDAVGAQPRGQVGAPRTFGITLKADF
jgi:outer membrane receptor protein involved in Fe transport